MARTETEDLQIFLKRDVQEAARECIPSVQRGTTNPAPGHQICDEVGILVLLSQLSIKNIT